MKTLRTLTWMLPLLLLAAAGAYAQDDAAPAEPRGNGVCQFVDADGDGFNDLAPDHDGDGIPNGLDPDWVKPEDGTGNMNRYAWQYGEMLRQFFGGDAPYGPGEDAPFAYGPGDGTAAGPAPGGFGPGEAVGGTPEETGAVQERRQGRR